MRIPILLLLASTLVACGDESTGELCAAVCDYETRCDQGVEETCECQFDEAKVRPQAAARLTQCYQSLTCAESDDRCEDFALNGVSVRDIDDTYSEQCLSSVETCGTLDDFCAMSPLFEETNVEDAITCFAGSCSDVHDCLLRALAQ